MNVSTDKVCSACAKGKAKLEMPDPESKGRRLRCEIRSGVFTGKKEEVSVWRVGGLGV